MFKFLGADSAILDRLRDNNEELVHKVRAYLKDYSKKGLRVLCMAKRKLSTEEYLQWNLNHNQAETSLANREEKLSQSYSSLENNMQLLGKN